ncbi:MAG: hypothetical protein QOG82_1826 [Actinomycetota bacterium]|jgi:uncharacterized membrane protein YqjE|nr:hypothetical protein [Actinomycetota bacterium]
MIAGLVIAFVIFGLFGLFGLGVWRMVDPAQLVERDTGELPRRLSLWDQVRTLVWWTMILGIVIIGIPAVVIYLADPAQKDRGQVALVGVMLLGVLAGAIHAWTARCKTTGERVLLCHCPRHSGE